jgi:hypothetical protein
MRNLSLPEPTDASLLKSHWVSDKGEEEKIRDYGAKIPSDTASLSREESAAVQNAPSGALERVYFPLKVLWSEPPGA